MFCGIFSVIIYHKKMNDELIKAAKSGDLEKVKELNSLGTGIIAVNETDDSSIPFSLNIEELLKIVYS